jgi:hypothetical protein
MVSKVFSPFFGSLPRDHENQVVERMPKEAATARLHTSLGRTPATVFGPVRLENQAGKS